MNVYVITQGRYDIAETLLEAQLKLIPTFPHQPDIGVNAMYPVESSRGAFFDRLYAHRHVKDKLIEANLTEVVIGEKGRDVRKDAKLTKAQADKVVERCVLLFV